MHSRSLALKMSMIRWSDMIRRSNVSRSFWRSEMVRCCRSHLSVRNSMELDPPHAQRQEFFNDLSLAFG